MSSKRTRKVSGAQMGGVGGGLSFGQKGVTALPCERALREGEHEWVKWEGCRPIATYAYTHWCCIVALVFTSLHGSVDLPPDPTDVACGLVGGHDFASIICDSATWWGVGGVEGGWSPKPFVAFNKFLRGFFRRIVSPRGTREDLPPARCRNRSGLHEACQSHRVM